jgi:hypothetical protein
MTRTAAATTMKMAGMMAPKIIATAVSASVMMPTAQYQSELFSV